MTPTPARRAGCSTDTAIPLELAHAARALSDALGELERLRPTLDALAAVRTRHGRSDAYDSYLGDLYEPAELAMLAAEQELLGAMREADVHALIVGGRLYVDNHRAWGDGFHEYPREVAVLDASRLAGMGGGR